MSSLFEAGPWDNAEAVAGVHVFDKKRKLLHKPCLKKCKLS